MFPWEDGTDFPANFDWKSPSKQPFFTKGEMVPTRDPRLYENVACPGDTYCNGTTAPVYINHADYKDGSGFLIMKYILQENNDREGPVQWSHTRLAEIMLGYAEVLNEVNGRPTDEAYNGKRCTKESRSAGTFQDDESRSVPRSSTERKSTRIRI